MFFTNRSPSLLRQINRMVFNCPRTKYKAIIVNVSVFFIVAFIFPVCYNSGPVLRLDESIREESL